MRELLLLALVLSFLWYGACQSRSDKTKVEPKDNKSKKNGSALSWYNLEDDNAKYFSLADELNEISGICFSGDNRLFCEEDENGNIYQLDTNSGDIIKKFSLGDTAIKGDFEDLAIVGERFFLMNSKGKILEFREGENNGSVQYKIDKTFLTKENNVEGLCYDPETNALLLACKDSPGEGYDKMRAVYSFPLSIMALDEKARFLIPIKSIKKGTLENEFNPSGISRQPVSGTFFIIASRGNTIIEVSKSGELLDQKNLSESIHIQPEGIAFSKENKLFISNEGKNKHARIAVYPMNK